MGGRLMDPIDAELQSRHGWDAALIQPDPAAIVNANTPTKARWILWAHGAAGLLAGDKQRAGIWLQACIELTNKDEHRGDRLWTAEVYSGLSELSLLDGEYFDALGRSRNACLLWRSIETAPSAREPAPRKRKRTAAESSVEPKDYVDGAVSEAIQDPDGALRPAPAAREMVRQRAIRRFLSGIETALRANEYAGQHDPELERVAEECVNEHADIISQENLYAVFNAFGNQASAAGAIQESLDWFNRAVDLYYQRCRDERDLHLLIQALFNKANALARLGQYDEALGIYRM